MTAQLKNNGGENFCCGWDSPAHNHCDVTGARFWAQQLQGAVPVPDSQHQQNVGRNAQNWCQIRHRPGTGTMSVETRYGCPQPIKLGIKAIQQEVNSYLVQPWSVDMNPAVSA